MEVDLFAEALIFVCKIAFISLFVLYLYYLIDEVNALRQQVKKLEKLIKK